MIVPLTSQYDMVEEGMVMRNCIATYVDECQQSDYQIISVRRGDEEVVAHMGLRKNQKNDTWNLQDVRGRMNSGVSRQIMAIAHEAARCANM